MTDEGIKIEQEPTQVTWRRCTQCNAAQMEFQLREEGICQECYISNLEKENAELKKELQDYQFNYDNIKELTNENAELSNSVLEFSNSVIELTNSKTELENKVTELEKQIEKMKCCENCKHHNIFAKEVCEDCNFFGIPNAMNDKWEMAK